MYLMIGAVACFLAVVLYAWAYRQYYRANGPVWSKGQLFASTVSLIVTALGAVGTGFVTAGLGDHLSSLQLVGWVFLAATVVATWYTVRVLMRRPVA